MVITLPTKSICSPKVLICLETTLGQRSLFENKDSSSRGRFRQGTSVHISDGNADSCDKAAKLLACILHGQSLPAGTEYALIDLTVILSCAFAIMSHMK